MDRMKCLAILLGIVCFTCKTVPPMQADHPERIVFGSFGGFAGSFQEHILTPDGSTFNKMNHQGKIIEGQLDDQRMVKQSFSVVEQLYVDGYEISDKGNMTYYMKLYTGDEEKAEWIWGGMNQKPDPRLQVMFNTLSNLCKNSSAPLR